MIETFELTLLERLVEKGLIDHHGRWTPPEIGPAMKAIRRLSEQKYFVILSILAQDRV